MILKGVLAIGLLTITPLIHDRLGPNWIAEGNFRSPIDGSHCCGVFDCAQVNPDDIQELRHGHVIQGYVSYPDSVKQDNVIPYYVNETVPNKEIQRSKDGNYWRCKKPDDTRRCYFAPPRSV